MVNVSVNMQIGNQELESKKEVKNNVVLGDDCGQMAYNNKDGAEVSEAIQKYLQKSYPPRC